MWIRAGRWLWAAAVLPWLFGCQLLAAVAPTPTAIPTTTFPPTRPATMTPTATVTPTPMPALSQAELIERWRTPIYVNTLLIVACNEGVAAAQASAAGQASETETQGAALALRLLMGVAEGGLGAWQPAGGAAAFQPELQDHAAAMNAVFMPWSDGIIHSEQAEIQLEPECEAALQTLDAIIAASRAEGLSHDSLDIILEEVRQNVEGLGSPGITATPAAPDSGE